jgi:hypothetical protein
VCGDEGGNHDGGCVSNVKVMIVRCGRHKIDGGTGLFSEAFGVFGVGEIDGYDTSWCFSVFSCHPKQTMTIIRYFLEHGSLVFCFLSSLHSESFPPQSLPRLHTYPSNLLLPSTPDPFFILPPLPLGIPKAPSSLSSRALVAKSTIKPQERIRIPLTQHRLALTRVPALGPLTLARKLARPFGGFDGAQRLRGQHDACRQGKDGEEQLERDVRGEGRRCKGCGVFVRGVDAGRRLARSVGVGMGSGVRVCEEQGAECVEDCGQESHGADW